MSLTKRTNYFVLFLFVNQLFWGIIWPFIAIPLNIPMLPQSILMEILLFIVPTLIYFFITRESPKKVLSLHPLGWKNVFWIIVFSIAIQPTMSLLSFISLLFFPNNVSTVLEATRQENILLFFTTFAITPAICEEVFFRGVVFSGYRYQSIGKACLLTGLLFGFMHMDGQQFLYTFVLGVIFCYMVYRTKSIFAAMLSHFTINGSQSLMAYFFLSAPAPDVPDLPVNPILPVLGLLTMFLLSVPFLAASLWFFLKNNPEQPYLEAQLASEGFADYHPERGAKEQIMSIPLVIIFTLWLISVILFPFLQYMMTNA